MVSMAGFTIEIQTVGGGWGDAQKWLFPCSSVGVCDGGGGGPQGGGDSPWCDLSLFPFHLLHVSSFSFVIRPRSFFGRNVLKTGLIRLPTVREVAVFNGTAVGHKRIVSAHTTHATT